MSSARSANFVASEKTLLLDLLVNYPVITSKKTDAGSLKEKQLKWEQLTTEFNANSQMSRRTVKNLKDLWKNLKNRAKSVNAERVREQRKTGGGPPRTDQQDPLVDIVTAIVPNEIKSLENSYDCDAPGTVSEEAVQKLMTSETLNGNDLLTIECFEDDRALFDESDMVVLDPVVDHNLDLGGLVENEDQNTPSAKGSSKKRKVDALDELLVLQKQQKEERHRLGPDAR